MTSWLGRLYCRWAHRQHWGITPDGWHWRCLLDGFEWEWSAKDVRRAIG